MAARNLELALIHEVFHGPDGNERLVARLAEARDLGAELALLPELPVDPWLPATRDPRDEDAEPPGGERHRRLSEAARTTGCAVHGGAIVRDPRSGRRHNRALLFDATGELVAHYDKLHLPSEEGFYESDHYEPGEEPPRRIDAFSVVLGLQICSDLQRPFGCQLLASLGVEAIVAPRATPPASYERWRTVIRGNAITGAAYVVSVNRPEPEQGVSIGGPSIVVGPDGTIVAETTEPLTRVTLHGAAVGTARRDYPGYLDLRADLYARGWSDLADDR